LAVAVARSTQATTGAAGSTGTGAMGLNTPQSEEQVTADIKLAQAKQVDLNRQKRSHRVNNEAYFRMHPELRQMVAAFTSALLARKPPDVALFAEEYFTDPELPHKLGLVGWSRPDSPEPLEADLPDDDYDEMDLNPELSGTTEMDINELEKVLIGLFKEADADNSGTLDQAEFAEVMATADLGLSKSALKTLLAEADENNDGVVTYAEFVPLAVEVIQTMRLKQRYQYLEADITEEHRFTAEQIVGLDASQFAAFVRDASARLGTGGALTKSQLKALLKQPALGLSKQQANTAAIEMPADADGSVSVDSLVEGLYEVVIKVVADVLARQNLGEVGDMIVAILEFYDKESVGYLDKKVVKSALLQAFPFVTKLQLTSLIAEAPIDAEGMLAWKEFLPKLTAYIKAYADPEATRERFEMAQRAEFAPVEMMGQMDKKKFDEKLGNLFRQADADNSGTLDAAEFHACVDGMDLGLSHGDIRELMEYFDADGDNTISIDEFLEVGYTVLAQLAREKKIFEEMYA